MFLESKRAQVAIQLLLVDVVTSKDTVYNLALVWILTA